MAIYLDSSANRNINRILGSAINKVAPEIYLQSQVRSMSAEQLQDIALTYLVERLKDRKRARVLVIERDAQRGGVVSARVDAPGKRVIIDIPKAEIERRDNSETAAPDSATIHKIREDQQARIDADSAARWEAIRAQMADAMDALRESWHVEWTRELLDAEFAVGDGTTTTWGNATREQHMARLALHERNAAAGIEGALRHREALDVLDSSGALCLNEARRVGANPQTRGGERPDTEALAVLLD
jgi:hypothetical protein